MVSKLLVAFLATLICYLYIEMSPQKNAYLVSNIILFGVSWVVTSLAFDSYDRSFEVILITVLFCPADKVMTSNLLAHIIDSEEAEKEHLYQEIRRWYDA